MLVIAPYDAEWPAMFTIEAERLRTALGPAALRIEHVGSTAVPGLAAKAVIDIQVSVASLGAVGQYAEQLGGLGYQHVHLGDFDAVYPFFVRPPEWPSTHHVHLCAAGGVQEARHLAFRDALRQQPGLAADYLRLKRSLAARHHGNTLASREDYSMSKTDFVENVLAQSGLSFRSAGAAGEQTP